VAMEFIKYITWKMWKKKEGNEDEQTNGGKR
jgi:hypothetical protein